MTGSRLLVVASLVGVGLVGRNPSAGPGVSSAGPAAPGPAPAERNGGFDMSRVAGPQERRPPRIQVVYPASGATIASTDSNFIFGSVTPATASLRINGTPVRVHPGGGFLAWLPLPRGSSTYELIAVSGRDSSRLSHPVRLLPPAPVLAESGALIVDSASASPRRPMMLFDDEDVRVSVRAPANAQVFVSWNGGRRALVSASSLPDASFDPGVMDSVLAGRFRGSENAWATLVKARELRRDARLVIIRGRDTVSLPLSRIQSTDSAAPLFGLLGATDAEVPDTDRVVIARPSPGGTYKWTLLAGTIVEVTGRDGDFVRVRLDSTLDVWIPVAEVQLMPRGYSPARPLPLNSRLVSQQGWVDLVIPMGMRAPYHVETFEDRIELTLYGVRANLDNVVHPTSDSLVRTITTAQETSDRARVTLNLTRKPFGYQVLWRGGDFVLRVRRPPAVVANAPLRGLTIAVDAGHPPAGATGPTGLYEGVANLQIARRLQSVLEARGAKVIMLRTTDDPVPLAIRPVMARRADAHALVSIHLNALPDGINPFTAHGTSTYYFRELSAQLARDVQGQMVRRLQLRDLGVMYNTFAVTRLTWMPSILCEGAFIMIPEQEAAIRTLQFQSAYATAVADGLQRYFGSLGSRR